MNDDLNFHYNRKKRLEHAPIEVKSYYDGTAKKPPKGFFKALVHTRTSRFLLIAVILSLLLVLFTIIINNNQSSGTLAEIPFNLSAFSFEDKIYVSLKAKNNKQVQNKLLDISFFTHTKEKTILNTHKTQQIYTGNEIFIRTIFEDYDIIEVTAVVTYNNDTLKLRTNIKVQ